jgi:hypothetical protein
VPITNCRKQPSHTHNHTYGNFQEQVAEFSIKSLNIANITEVAQTINQVGFYLVNFIYLKLK